MQYLTGDARLYVWPKQLDKEDYAVQIADAEKGAFVDGEYVVTDDSRRTVQELKELQAAAPDKVERIYTDATLNYGFGNDGEQHTDVKCVVSVGAEYGNKDDAAIVVSNGLLRGAAYTRMYYARGRLLDAESLAMQNDPIDPNPNYVQWMQLVEALTIDASTAQLEAQQVLSDLRIQYMALVKTENGVVLSYDNEGGLSSQRADVAVHIFTFVPLTETGMALPLAYPYAASGSRRALPGQGGAIPEGADYALRNIEMIQIAIGVNGIEYFKWDMPSVESGTLSSSSELLPFEQMQNRVKEVMRGFVAPDEVLPAPSDASSFVSITVRNVELITYPVFDGESIENYTLMPVWKVVYDVAVEETYGNGREVRKDEPQTRPCLLLSATDGTLLMTK